MIQNTLKKKKARSLAAGLTPKLGTSGGAWSWFTPKISAQKPRIQIGNCRDRERVSP